MSPQHIRARDGWMEKINKIKRENIINETYIKKKSTTEEGKKMTDRLLCPFIITITDRKIDHLSEGGKGKKEETVGNSNSNSNSSNSSRRASKEPTRRKTSLCSLKTKSGHHNVN